MSAHAPQEVTHLLCQSALKIELAKREAYLKGACREDESLHEEVEAGRFVKRQEGRGAPKSGEVIKSPLGAQGRGEEMPIRLTGMSEVTRNMEALKRALDGAVEKASFSPHNPQDVERTIRGILMKVDMKMAPYMTSPGVREIAAGLKEEYRQRILHKAEEARKKSPS